MWYMNSVLYRAQEGTGTEAFLRRKRIGKERNRDCLLIHRHRIPCWFSPFSVKFSFEERFGKERKRDCLLIRLHTTPSLPIFFISRLNFSGRKELRKSATESWSSISRLPSYSIHTFFGFLGEIFLGRKFGEINPMLIMLPHASHLRAHLKTHNQEK